MRIRAHAEGNAGFERVADRGGNAGVGHGHDDVGVDGMFAREQAAEAFAALVHRAAENQAIGPRKIDVLEDAVLQRLFRREVERFDAAARDAHHFAGLDFAHVFGADQIERAGFRSDEPGAAEAAEAQRAEAARIADGVHFVARQHQQRVGAFDLIQRVGERAGEIARAAARDQVHDHFGVAGGLEDRAAMFERAAQLDGVGEVAVVRRARDCPCCNRSRWAAR